MPNIASVFKEEMVRLARKEMRASGEALRKAVTAHRAEIFALKKGMAALTAQLRKLEKAKPAAPGAAAAAPDDAVARRFSAKGLASNRQRLGLSADDFGRLIGVSGQAIYAWESGTRPRDRYLAAIAATRTMGKRAALAALEQAGAAQ